MAATEPPPALSPVTIVSAGDDALVKNRGAMALVARLPLGRYIEDNDFLGDIASPVTITSGNRPNSTPQ